MFEAGPDLSTLKLATAALAAAAGFAFTALHLFAARRTDRTLDWPTTEGIVSRARLVRRWGLGSGVLAGGLWWVPEISYRYEVGGKAFTGRRTFSSEKGFAKKSQARALIERHPPGSSVEVFYDPARPKRAFLERARSETRVLGVALLFFVIAGAALIAG